MQQANELSIFFYCENNKLIMRIFGDRLGADKELSEFGFMLSEEGYIFKECKVYPREPLELRNKLKVKGIETKPYFSKEALDFIPSME